MEGDSKEDQVQVVVDIPPDFQKEVFIAQIELEDFEEHEIEEEIAAETIEVNNNQSDQDQDHEPIFHPPSLSEAIKGLETLRAYLQSSGTASNEDMQSLARLENTALRDKLASREDLLTQKKISSFFTKP